MSDFTIYTPENAPVESKVLLSDLRSKLGFLPNLFGVLAESPAALQAYPTFNGAFEKTSFSPTEQKVITLATGVENECQFCASIHSAIARGKMKIDGAVVDALREGRDGPDAKLNALANFTRAVVAKRGAVDGPDAKAFLEAGYTKAQMLEVVVGVAHNVFTNYVNNMARTPLNDEFKAEAWTKDKKRKAA